MIGSSLSWQPLVGGALIGLAAALLWVLSGRVAGISGICGGFWTAPPGDRSWRGGFLAGLGAGGVILGGLRPGAFGVPATSWGMTAFAGVLVGIGTTLANGCTSGHGVCGLGRFSKRSLAATGTFMLAGMVVVHLLRKYGVSL